MPDELLPRVEKWLQREGYPLQMRVARKFRQKTFHVTESTYYEDLTTKKTREIDVVASAGDDPLDINPDFRFRITFMIECKQTAHQPWILFTTDEHRLPDTCGLSYRPMTGFGHMLSYKLGFDKILENEFFALPERPAYGITDMPVIQKIDTGLLVLNSLGAPSAISVITYAALDRFADESWQMTQKLIADGKSIVRDIALQLKKDTKGPSITAFGGGE